MAPRASSSSEVARAPPDHDAELDLPVELRRAARLTDRIVRPDQRVRALGEQDGFCGYVLPGLRGMVAVVEADAQDLVRPRDRRTTRSPANSATRPAATRSSTSTRNASYPIGKNSAS